MRLLSALVSTSLLALSGSCGFDLRERLHDGSEPILTLYDRQYYDASADKVSPEHVLIAGVGYDDGVFGRQAQLVSLASGEVQAIALPYDSQEAAAWVVAVRSIDARRALFIDGEIGAERSALYDVASRSFRVLETPAVHGQQVVRLASGDVLWSNGPRESALFEQESERWTLLPKGDGSATYGTSTLLADGRVLITGISGNRDDDPPAAFVYEPATRAFSVVAAPPEDREHGYSVLLPDGRVLIAGGRVDDAAVVSTLLYDPTLNSWASGPKLAGPRGAGEFVRQGDDVYLMGGVEPEPCAEYACGVARVERLRAGADSFESVSTFDPQVSVKFAEVRDENYFVVSSVGVFRFPRP